MSIELPKDAKGREIPLDTNVLYDQDGDPREVARFTYTPSRDYDRWDVIFVDGYDRYASEMLLELPDSWEKLEEDLNRAASKAYYVACTYFGMNSTNCDKCTIGDLSSCDSAAMSDIADRIRKLRGED